MDNVYRAYGLELTRWSNFTANDWFFRYEVYEAGNPIRPVSCFVWLLKSDARTVLVDCGVGREAALSRGLEPGRDVGEALNSVGVEPTAVDHVVLSHLHFDHCGNIDRFPNATFSISRAELEFWTGPFGDQPALSAPVEPGEVQQVLDLQRDDRLVLVEEELELFPGVRTQRVGGHTPGQTITTVELGGSQVVLAGDAIHFYEEMRLNRLYKVFTDAQEMLSTYEQLRQLEQRPGTVVVAGHDPEVMDMFEATSDGCVDLGAPVTGVTSG